MNKDKYNQMSDRQKKAIDDNCNTEAAGRVGEPWGKFEDAGIDKVKAEQGHEVYTLTPEQTALWKKAAEPLVKTWADGVKKAGADPDAAMAELRASLTKYNALASKNLTAFRRGGGIFPPPFSPCHPLCRAERT